jgi:hypothetical protein
MNASFNITSQRLDLSYTTTTQELFRRVLEPLRGFMESEHIGRCEPYLQPSLRQGFRSMERLTKSVFVQTTFLEIDDALDLVSFSSRYLALDRQSAELFARVVGVLAKVTPCPCPSLNILLPPADQVFQTQAVPVEIRQVYESIQSPTGSYVPYLAVWQMYEMWFYLRAIRSSSPAFRALVSGLDAHTMFFRATMSHLAQVDINNPAVGD